MNIYDFDKTIYKYDSSIRFFLYAISRKPVIIFLLPYQIWAYLLYKFHFITKERFKEIYFSFLKKFKNTNMLVIEFWNKEERNIADWYKEQKRIDDIVISASPYFLIYEMCRRLGIQFVIATDVDINTGSFRSKNCYGEEKVNRLYKEFPNIDIENFYSDSNSDIYLAKKAKKAYKVEKTRLIVWRVDNE